MADNKRSRAAIRGLRTRERTIQLNGPITRISAREKEVLRLESGDVSLHEAYGGIPNRADFTKHAHLFERNTLGKKPTIDRAFILPEGLQELKRGTCIELFWYRRDTGVQSLMANETIRVSTLEGERYELCPEDDVQVSTMAKIGSSKYSRSCTGAARFFIS
jgi:hypothetical protein